MISIDFLVILGLIAVFSFLSFYFGKNKSIAFLMSFYLGLLFYQKAPFVSKLVFMKGNLLQETINNLLIYIAFVVILYLITKKHFESFDSDTSVFKAILVGISFTVFILAFTHFVIPTDVLYNFGPKVDSFFTESIGFFPYLTATLIILLFV